MDPSGDGGGGLTAAALLCGSCGAQSSPTAKFCGECGTRLTQSIQSAEYKQVTVLFADVVHSMGIAAAVGAERLREMMLTGRRITADEGQRLGLSHELVEVGAAEARARALAVQIAGNAPLTNQLILTALPRISDMSRNDGFWAEALTTAVSQSTADADEGLRAFLEKRPPDFRGE